MSTKWIQVRLSSAKFFLNIPDLMSYDMHLLLIVN